MRVCDAEVPEGFARGEGNLLDAPTRRWNAAGEKDLARRLPERPAANALMKQYLEAGRSAGLVRLSFA